MMPDEEIRREIDAILDGKHLPQNSHYWNGLEQVTKLLDFRENLSESKRETFDNVVVTDYLDSRDGERMRLAVNILVYSQSQTGMDSIIERLR